MNKFQRYRFIPGFIVVLCRVYWSCALLRCNSAEPTRTIDLGDGVKIELVLIEPGIFTQGSAADRPGRGDDEYVERQVTISQAFYLGKTPVTQAGNSRNSSPLARDTGPKPKSGASRRLRPGKWHRLVQKAGLQLGVQSRIQADRRSSRCARHLGRRAGLLEMAVRKDSRKHSASPRKPNGSMPAVPARPPIFTAATARKPPPASPGTKRSPATVRAPWVRKRPTLLGPARYGW